MQHLHTLVIMSPPNNTHLVHHEGRIAPAIEALNQGRSTSVGAAAKSYDVPRSTLQYRLDKHPARRNSRPTSCKLTETEESTLVQWILSMDERGLPPRSNTVRQMANLLLQKRCQNRIVGQRWVYNFVQRHEAFKSRYNRKYDYQGAKCEIRLLFETGFDLYGIQWQNMGFWTRISIILMKQAFKWELSR
jgi:hypothetical protein